MSDRFAELLAKAKIGPISDAEREELALFLNAPILEPLVSPLPVFVSKYAFAPIDLSARLSAINWFAHCGKRTHLDLTMEIVFLGDWTEAMQSSSDVSWENAQLEAQNQLTSWLHKNRIERYSRWNELVTQHKSAMIEPLSRGKWESFQQENGLGVGFVHSVQWDILGAMMANSYLDTGHQCFFSLELLRVYEAGHFPCGWRGDWPNGKLLVF